MKPWHLGAIFACIVILAVGSVAGIVLYVTDREDDRQAGLAAELILQQMSACERGNVLRLRASIAIEVLEEFTRAAAETRRAAANDPDATRADSNRDAGAAARYEALGKQLVTIPQVDCSKIIDGGR